MQKVEDTGRLSDAVRVIISVADREGRTHRYGYRDAMRYQIDERDDGMTFISFWCDPENRAPEALNPETIESSLIARLMAVVVAEDPKLMNGDAGAAGAACGALAEVMGMLMASIYTKRPDAYPHVRGKVIEKIDYGAAKTLDKVQEYYEQAQRAGSHSAS